MRDTMKIFLMWVAFSAILCWGAYVSAADWLIGGYDLDSSVAGFTSVNDPLGNKIAPDNDTGTTTFGTTQIPYLPNGGGTEIWRQTDCEATSLNIPDNYAIAQVENTLRASTVRGIGPGSNFTEARLSLLLDHTGGVFPGAPSGWGADMMSTFIHGQANQSMTVAKQGGGIVTGAFGVDLISSLYDKVTGLTIECRVVGGGPWIKYTLVHPNLGQWTGTGQLTRAELDGNGNRVTRLVPFNDPIVAATDTWEPWSIWVNNGETVTIETRINPGTGEFLNYVTNLETGTITVRLLSVDTAVQLTNLIYDDEDWDDVVYD